MPPEAYSHDTFLSVFTWRYGSPEMRRLFSEHSNRATWRKLWVHLAEAQAGYGLVSKGELEDLRGKMTDVDIERSHEIEKRIRHDLMAEIRAYAEQAPVGGGKLHLGATSADIEDNADMIRIRRALDLILTRLTACLASVTKIVSEHKGTVCMGWTHLQPAEPTTLGYRFANYAQDLVLDVQLVEGLSRFTRGKGFKGAVGTSSSYTTLVSPKGNPRALEDAVMKKVGLEAFPVATQTYPRKIDYLVVTTLASIAQSAHRFASDIRLLQSPVFGELLEPIREEQIGSSTMAFKRNPVTSERICSLARYVATLPTVAFMNASNTLLERTLDDSANRRIIIPEGFLAVEEILLLYNSITSKLRLYPHMMKRNLERFGIFSATETLLIRLTALGADRQAMHEKIRSYSFQAWEKVLNGEENPLIEMLRGDPTIRAKLASGEVDRLLDPSNYTGDAAERCTRFLAEVVQPILTRHKGRLAEQPPSVF